MKYFSYALIDNTVLYNNNESMFRWLNGYMRLIVFTSCKHRAETVRPELLFFHWHVDRFIGCFAMVVFFHEGCSVLLYLNNVMSTRYMKPCVITNLATRRFRISSCFYRSVVPTAPHNDWVFITRLRPPSQCVYTRLSHASASGSTNYLLAFWNFVLSSWLSKTKRKIVASRHCFFFQIG